VSTPRPLPIDDLEQLTWLPRAKLITIWSQVMGRSRPPIQRRLLIRDLAYRIQEQHSGGLDTNTQRLLSTAIRALDADDPRTPSPPRKTTQRTRVSRPPAASRLIRVYRGVAHEVTIGATPGTFIYRGVAYRSLSAIARLITGGSRSGPLFFGLTRQEEHRR
jgi:hypothetical protein